MDENENKTVVNINSMECTENFVAVPRNAHRIQHTQIAYTVSN